MKKDPLEDNPIYKAGFNKGYAMSTELGRLQERAKFVDRYTDIVKVNGQAVITMKDIKRWKKGFV